MIRKKQIFDCSEYFDTLSDSERIDLTGIRLLAISPFMG
jgi:hypothetical protein